MNTQNISTQLTQAIEWLGNQNDPPAQCAKQILEGSNASNIRLHISDITDRLAQKSVTSAKAGFAYTFIVTKGINK